MRYIVNTITGYIASYTFISSSSNFPRKYASFFKVNIKIEIFLLQNINKQIYLIMDITHVTQNLFATI